MGVALHTQPRVELWAASCSAAPPLVALQNPETGHELLHFEDFIGRAFEHIPGLASTPSELHKVDFPIIEPSETLRDEMV